MTRLHWTAIVFVSAFLSGNMQAWAQASTPIAPSAAASATLFNRSARPVDINNIPVLANLVRSGAKLHYMGERSGVHGWFVVKNGQVQMIYATADSQTVIIGGLFTPDGETITGAQISALAETNKEVADIINGSAKQQEDITRAGSVPGGFAALPAGTGSAGTGNDMGNKVPSVALSPGERLLQDLQAAAGVDLGKNDNAQVLMVFDPNCPHCQATWRELRESVTNNRVQVKLIPITKSDAAGVLDKEDLRVGARLLQASNPLETWDKYTGGNKAVLEGEGDQIHTKAILENNKLVDRWNIRGTPYLVYRSKDGRVKIVQGKPERMAAVLSDLPK